MSIKDKNKVQIGDWVKLQSSKGEHIQGYVEKETNNNDVLQLRVIASDNQLLSGHSIQVQTQKLEKDQAFQHFTIGELEQLIDLALLTNDKAWFDSLTKEYKALQAEKENLKNTI
ncbi:IDEAL domain-containing protein [Amphibacillus sp. Q70]|uniref:IDEAL domain-containing protein n=1 Tax=Amphibacillus sp. Q70 TaxID=3453416 RepID=UPI003F85E2A0